MRTVTEETITKVPSTGIIDGVVCQKIGDLVIASARIYNLNVAASADFFLLPSAFRPARSQKASGYMIINGTSYAVLATISTSGRVNLTWSASATTSQVGFVAVFPVA